MNQSPLSPPSGFTTTTTFTSNMTHHSYCITMTGHQLQQENSIVGVRYWGQRSWTFPFKYSWFSLPGFAPGHSIMLLLHSAEILTIISYKAISDLSIPFLLYFAFNLIFSLITISSCYCTTCSLYLSKVGIYIIDRN